MANPLYTALGGGQMPGPLGNAQQMIQQFRQFRNMFHGNPRQKVMDMVQKGEINQSQLNYLQQVANQCQWLMNG